MIQYYGVPTYICLECPPLLEDHESIRANTLSERRSLMIFPDFQRTKIRAKVLRDDLMIIWTATSQVFSLEQVQPAPKILDFCAMKSCFH